jgi:hypothetical protein
VVLTKHSPLEARFSAAPPDVALDGSSLGDGERTTAPPPADELLVVDEATPEDLQAIDVTLEALDEVAEPDDVHEGRMQSGSVPKDGSPEPLRMSNVHTRPTVRMVAVDAVTLAAVKRRDPRREEE